MNNRKVAAGLVVVGALIIIVSYYFIIKNDIKGVAWDGKKDASQLSDFQLTACNSADKSGTCRTKLPKLNLITPEECCSILGKCCQK